MAERISEKTRSVERSVELYREALELLPGGVDSPARAFKSVGGQPLFIDRGKGSWIYDVDGNAYIDYILSFGPLILGHAREEVLASIVAAAARGTSFGATSPLELELARLVKRFMPSIELIRFVNSGTEATMSVLRLARAFTGRDKIVKFAGNYHGHADMLLVQAGSGVATLMLPDSPGVPQATVSNTIVAPYNDLDAIQQILDSDGSNIAAIIVEPVAGNMGTVLPRPGYLQGLRALSKEHGVLLIFDEVMTGFRVHRGGAQALYDVKPDLTALGKVIGGGLPVGAYGGRKDIMEMVAPAGPVYQAGTLSGNPLAMSAGIATLSALEADDTWEKLLETTNALVTGIGDAADDEGIAIQQSSVGTMFCTFFTQDPVYDFATASRSDTETFGRFFRSLLDHGVLLPPSQFESCFVSTAHGPDEVQATIQAFARSFNSLHASGLQ